MKIAKISIVLLLIALTGTQILAQTVGELDRFGGETLEKKNEVKLYPNPTVDVLSIRITNSDLENVEFSVHNIIGNTIEVAVESTDQNVYRINVESLPSGYYLLTIKDDKRQFRETYKFLKR